MSIAPVLELPTFVAGWTMNDRLHSPTRATSLLRTAALPTLAGAVLTDTVHLWLLPGLKSEETELLADMRGVLSADECARADSFYFPAHRAAFVANHARMRLLLASYLGCGAESLSFSYGAQGKPVLAAAEHRGLTFNLSHTDGLAVLGVTRDRRIGVDVEKVKPMPDLLEVAQQNFSEMEYAQLSALPADEQCSAFYACWTRKEAFLKGVGIGLAQDLKQIQVNLLPGERAQVLACQWAPEWRHSWRLQALTPGDGYAGALAYEHAPHNLPLGLQTFTWPYRDTPA